MAALEDYDLVAVCDLKEEVAREAAEGAGDPEIYTDYATMLMELKPDVVAIATPTSSHAELTFQAIETGVRGIYCEKPMATNLADARRMVELCRDRGIALAINHQRRIGAVYYMMRRLLEEGAVGEPYLIRGSCGGDVLSDGTHTVDSILHLVGDCEVRWVFGQIYRESPDPSEKRSTGFTPSGGWRYGHMIETGAMAVFELENGLRAEIFTGGIRLLGRGYQDVEVFGSKGRLWHPGDRSDPPLLIWNGKSGGWRPVPMFPEHPLTATSTSENLYHLWGMRIEPMIYASRIPYFGFILLRVSAISASRWTLWLSSFFLRFFKVSSRRLVSNIQSLSIYSFNLYCSPLRLIPSSFAAFVLLP
jgi:predicted dehydrogenase